jgi:hypothetical protein
MTTTTKLATVCKLPIDPTIPFGEYEEGKVETVYDYAVFCDVNVYPNSDDEEYVFEALYNQGEMYITLKAHPQHSEMMLAAMERAEAGKMTFARIVLTNNDGYLCELFDAEAMAQLIPEKKLKYLKKEFHSHVARGTAKAVKYYELCNMIQAFEDDGSAELEEKIGSWKRKRTLLGSDLAHYIKIMKAEAELHRVHFPVSAFIN